MIKFVTVCGQRCGPNTRTLQENTIYVDNAVSSSTTIIINDSCNLGSSLEPEDGNNSDADLSDFSEDCAQDKMQVMLALKPAIPIQQMMPQQILLLVQSKPLYSQKLNFQLH